VNALANEEHLSMLRRSIANWNLWRLQNPQIVPGLIMANLGEVNLIGANLSEADLRWASFIRANLSEADFIGTNLGDADLSNATTESTSFSNIDLSQAKGLGLVIHSGPSSIGVDTLTQTLRGSGGRFTPEQVEFFVNAGVPYTLLDYLPGLLETDPLQFYKCFISYSTQDEAFAELLNQGLDEAGVKTWKWNMDAVPGRDLRENIDRAIKNYDKMILACSVNSLNSGPVEREIERALQKEGRLKAAKAERDKEALGNGIEPLYVDTDVLVPITIDDTISSGLPILLPTFGDVTFQILVGRFPIARNTSVNFSNLYRPSTLELGPHSLSSHYLC
jgi:TIR domain/Pentapeptide repeats (8 copies)